VAPAPRVAVVGHVEWVEFVRVERVPRAGQIVHGGARWEEPAGGGAVAAVQLCRLAGRADLFTALGDDELGHRSLDRLRELGLTVHVAWREEPTRRALTLLDGDGERTIVTLGDRLAPNGADALPWEELAEADAAYFTAGDAAALRAARAARVLVASPRGRDALQHGVSLDALVLSARDEDERREAERLAGAGPASGPGLVVLTEGASGGQYRGREGTQGHWSAAKVPGPTADSYGCGDSFAAGVTFGLARGEDVPAALTLAARCGAECLTGHGPYGRQLGAADL
jgi:ribokinase